MGLVYHFLLAEILHCKPIRSFNLSGLKSETYIYEGRNVLKYRNKSFTCHGSSLRIVLTTEEI